MKAPLKSAIITASLILSLNAIVFAQKYATVSRNPVKDAATARTALFSLPEGDSAYYFRADLPGEAFLTIQFGRLSYWQAGSLPDIVASAKLAWKQVQDSFVGVTTSRRLSVHLPPSGYSMIAAISEWGAEQRTLMIKGSSPQPVRISVDTITVLKTLESAGKDTGSKRQVLYTFLLKDLSEIEELAENAVLIGNISAAFDSLVAAKRSRWRNEDADHHRMEAQYDARNVAGTGVMQRVYSPKGLKSKLGFNGEIGTSFVAGTIAPYSSFRALYYLKSRGVAAKGFVALSFSTIAFLQEQGDRITARSLGFLNFEIGSLFSGNASRIPIYRTSVGFGHRVVEQDMGPYQFKYRVFFSYSVSKAVTITPELYGMPAALIRFGTEFAGLTLSVRLF